MTKRAVNPSTLSTPRGFSHAIEASGRRLLFLAGQVAFDQDGGVVGQKDLPAQFRQVMENLKTVAEAGGGTLRDIVKLTIYVLDKTLYQSNEKVIGQIYREYFGRYYPAMTLVEVQRLYDDGCMIEIDGIAVLE